MRRRQNEETGREFKIVTEFATYEEYLDSQIRPKDLYYLEDGNLARQLVELGCRGGGELLSREEFQQRKRAADNVRSQKRGVMKELTSEGKDLEGCPLLKELADKEDLVRNGKLSCIIFIRDRNKKGQEISGYIDYAYRLKTENFEPYFLRKKRLLPRPSDLSFYNWETQVPSSNHTPYFQVIADEKGLLFKNKRDRKIINVNPDSEPGDNTRRIELVTSEYAQVVIFDHLTRRKT